MSDPVLIQPVESPVICRPYYEPTHYWEYDKNTGRAQKMAGRRPASYWYKDPSADIRRGQMTLELEEDRRDLICVNKLRADVKRWRVSSWEGATNVTKDLFRHWWRKDRARRFFFCQLEAAETIIFLNEIAAFAVTENAGSPDGIPSFRTLILTYCGTARGTLNRSPVMRPRWQRVAGRRSSCPCWLHGRSAIAPGCRATSDFLMPP